MKKKFKPQEPYIYLVFGLNGKVRKIKAKASQVREILNATPGEEVTLNFFVGKEENLYCDAFGRRTGKPAWYPD